MLIRKMEAQREVDECWNVMTIRDPKRSTEGKMKLRDNELINSKGQKIVTANYYAVLETNSNMPRNENRMKIVYENKPRAINKEQKENMKYTGQDCSTTNEPHEELNMKTTVRLNLQSPSLNHQQSNIKEEEKTYTISSIINGQISRENTSRTIKQRTSLQNRVMLNTSKKTVTSAHRRYEILIVGDSHVRGLSKKVCNCLEGSFSVTGITKPNADTEVITSPLHLITNKLTKKYLLIFYVGTKDISRNKSKKGLH